MNFMLDTNNGSCVFLVYLKPGHTQFAVKAPSTFGKLRTLRFLMGDRGLGVQDVQHHVDL